MRKTILFIACSLDGFIAREDGEIDWLFTDQDYGYAEFIRNVDAILMGRKTYEQCLTFGDWPYPGKECFVFTHGKIDDSRIHVSTNPVLTTRGLIHKPGKDIWIVGGSEIVKELLNAQLTDELVISIHPIILGAGIPLFKQINETRLKLIDVIKFETGLLQIKYEVDFDLPTGL